MNTLTSDQKRKSPSLTKRVAIICNVWFRRKLGLALALDRMLVWMLCRKHGAGIEAMYAFDAPQRHYSFLCSLGRPLSSPYQPLVSLFFPT